MTERPGNGPLAVPVAATPVGAQPVPEPVTETPSSDAPLETIPGTSRLKGVALHVIGRLGAGILVLFGAVTVSFLLVHATGNPATVLAGGSLPASQVEALSKQLGYDRPLLSQYVSYIGGVLHGQFGVSFRYDTPAINSVISALPNTLLLIGVSLSAALILSIAIATSSVLEPERLGGPVLAACGAGPPGHPGLLDRPSPGPSARCPLAPLAEPGF